MGTSMASIAFRCSERMDWPHTREQLKMLFDGVEGLVNNLDEEGPGYAIVSPYGEMGMFLGEYAPQVSKLLQGYAVMTVCNDSDFACLTVYDDGEQVENCCVGELYEEFSEFMEITPPRLEFWKQLMPEDTQPEALQEALFEETGFAEDNLRMLSKLTGMRIFDDRMVYEML